MRLDLNDEPGICYKHSRLHQAIATTNCSIFVMCLHKIIVSFATLTMLRCRLAYWVSCCWLQSPQQKPLSWANRPLEGFLHHHPPFVSTNAFSTHCFFLRAHTAVPLLLVRHSAMLLKIQAAAKSRIRIAPQPSVFRNTS